MNLFARCKQMPIDRTRTLTVPAVNVHIPILSVDTLIIGGTQIYAEQGTRYTNGGLTIQGIDDNSVEIRLKPGPGLKEPGIVAQIMLFASDMVTKFKRFTIGINMDSTGGELVTVDSTSSSNTSAMPVYMPVMGGKSALDGSDVPGSDHYSFAYFQDGSHELYLSNGDRVGIVSVIEAWLANDKTLIVARDKAGNPVHYAN